MTLSAYVNQQVEALIENVSEAVSRAETDRSPEAIHRLRVSIRKLSECLRVFRDLFPGRAVKSVRKDLKAAMKLAGEARNHDIAQDLMKRAKVPVPSDVAEGRARALFQLAAVLKNWNQEHAFDSWRELLGG